MILHVSKRIIVILLGQAGKTFLNQQLGMKVYTKLIVTISKNLTVKSTMFPHRNIHKYTWTSPDGKNYNQIAIIW
jgi:hypothetical protein